MKRDEWRGIPHVLCGIPKEMGVHEEVWRGTDLQQPHAGRSKLRPKLPLGLGVGRSIVLSSSVPTLDSPILLHCKRRQLQHGATR
jgi:hypothetical protein